MSLFRRRAKQDAILLVCAKCFKRVDVKDRLSKPLSRTIKPLGYKLVRTRCLGVCPRDAVAIHDSRRPREWLIVSPDTPPAVIMTSLVQTVG